MPAETETVSQESAVQSSASALAKPEILNTLTQLQGRVPPALERPLQQLLQALTQPAGLAQVIQSPEIPTTETDAQTALLAALNNRLSGASAFPLTPQISAPLQQALQQWQMQVQLQQEPASWNSLSSQEQRGLQQQGILPPATGAGQSPALQQRLLQLNTLILSALTMTADPAAETASHDPSLAMRSGTDMPSPAAITSLSAKQQAWQSLGQTLQALQQQIQQLGRQPALQQSAQTMRYQLDVLTQQLQPQSATQPSTVASISTLRQVIYPAFQNMMTLVSATAVSGDVGSENDVASWGQAEPNRNLGMSGNSTIPAWKSWFAQVAATLSENTISIHSSLTNGLSQTTTAAMTQSIMQTHTDTLDTFFHLIGQLWQPASQASAQGTTPAFSSQHPLGQLLNQLLTEQLAATDTVSSSKNLLEQLTRPLQQSGDVQQWLQFLTQPISGQSAYTVAIQHWLWQRLQTRTRSSDIMLDPARPTATPAAPDDGIRALLQFLQPDKAGETGTQPLQLVIPLPLTRTEDETQWVDIQRGIRHEEGQSGWHLTLDLPLGSLGLIRCQAYIDLPNVALRFQAERTQAFDRLQETLPELQQRLHTLGLAVTQCQVKQGKIQRRPQQTPLETSGISIRI